MEPATTERAVRESLREARIASGMTLSDLSEATGIGVSTLSRLETGRRRLTLPALLAIAAAVGRRVAVSGDDSPAR